MNRMLLSTAALAGVLVLGAGVAAPADALVALPTTTFYFQGDCTDCADVGRGELTLAGTYQLGQAITQQNFISFHYDGTDLLGAFTITNADRLTALSGAINGPLPGTEDFRILRTSDNATLESRTGGFWCAGGACVADYGASHLWSQTPFAAGVPEPASWALTIVGFGLAGLAMRRRPSVSVTFG